MHAYPLSFPFSVPGYRCMCRCLPIRRARMWLRYRYRAFRATAFSFATTPITPARAAPLASPLFLSSFPLPFFTDPTMGECIRCLISIPSSPDGRKLEPLAWDWKGGILLRKGRWKGGITRWGPKVAGVHQGFGADGVSRGLDMKGEINRKRKGGCRSFVLIWLVAHGLAGPCGARGHDVNRRGKCLVALD